MEQRTKWMLIICLVHLTALGECSWGSPGSGQYHIQTDEGPERYFRFQTDNGQFRKEKRLQDGTVIGTEAWIDAAGFLRQKDYIADKEGYRILKSKTIYVGEGRKIEDAIKAAKSAPAQSGTLVDGTANSVGSSIPANRHNGYVYSTTTAVPTTPKSTTAAPVAVRAGAGKLSYLSPADAAELQPSGYLGFDHYPDEGLLPPLLPHTRRPHRPVVHIHPNSEPIDASNAVEDIDDHSNSIAVDYSNTQKQYGFSTTTLRPIVPSLPSPSVSMEPPVLGGRRRIRPIAVIASSPSPIAAHETGGRGYSYSSPAPFFDQARPSYETSSPRPLLSQDLNDLDGLLPPPAPTRRRNRLPSAAFEEYDGIAKTRNGFRYFLPRQYHEEEQIDSEKRAGSFGYVDPFGIRRVVYYNASPGRGFVHRNNNQYVGLDAAPYDPPSSGIDE